MVSLIDLKTSLYSNLNSIIKTFENGRVSKKELLPFATYELGVSNENLIDNVDSVNFILTINLLDHRVDKDTTWIETKVDEIDDFLNRKNIIENDFYYYCIRQGINPNLPTEDEFTQRRELTYLIKTYISKKECY